jgi:starch-binding outer membrane protein, SusD/RagB family
MNQRFSKNCKSFFLRWLLCYVQIGLIICSILFASCKKFVEVPLPENQIQADKVFSNDHTAISSIIGLYSQLMNSNLHLANGGLSVYTGLSSDEIVNVSPNSNVDQFAQNSLTPFNSLIKNNFWTSSYSSIYHANLILERLNISVNLTESVKSQLKGEAIFIRAFLYFYLTNLFGDVPLILKTDYRANTQIGRTPTSHIYQQIIQDLKDAQGMLTQNYVVNSAFPQARVRPNKSTVTAFLARVYLYQKDWANAESSATAVITSNDYNLVSTANIANVFLAGSSEAIWQLMPVIPNNNTAEGNIFLTTTTTIIPTYRITAQLLDAFEQNDQRRAKWINTNTIASTVFSFPAKYKIKTGGAPYSEYNMVLRLAEQYLIRSEARAQQNKFSESKADLAILRTRAGLTTSLPDDKSLILSAIEKERWVELFAEWGHRWFDLKRTNRANAVLSLVKGTNWQPTDALYPIPISELEANPLLTQNPGYN